MLVTSLPARTALAFAVLLSLALAVHIRDEHLRLRVHLSVRLDDFDERM